MTFKVGDKATLSQSGIKHFSVDNWADYSIPFAMYSGHIGEVEHVESLANETQRRIHVKVDGAGKCFFYEDQLKLYDSVEYQKPKKEEQYTGSSSDYYKVFVNNPTTLPESYYAECNDIIEALEMDFAEGNAFKAIWRKAKARQGVKKKGYDNGVYDSEKVVFFGERMLVKAKNEAD